MAIRQLIKINHVHSIKNNNNKADMIYNQLDQKMLFLKYLSI
jgi:hypothetical protein